MRLGIIGPGLIWQNQHKRTLAWLPAAFSIAAFCASSERRRAETLRDFPAASFETDLQAFVERGDIDAVVVLTPIHLNARVALAAISAGKDVFLEKPMAHTLQGGKELVEAALRHGRRVWVLEQQVYQEIWAKLKRLLAREVIGTPVFFQYVIHWPLDRGLHDRGGYGNTGWRIQPKYPLGLFFDGGHHQVAVLSTLFGEPEWVFATGSSLRKEFGAYDHIVMQVGYRTGLRGVLSHSACLAEKHNSFIIWGTRGSISVDGDSLLVEADRGDSERIGVPQQDAHLEMWSSLARSLSAGEPPVYTIEHAWKDLGVLFAVERSIATGGKVSLAP
jgi:predicted dehydrogenase